MLPGSFFAQGAPSDGSAAVAAAAEGRGPHGGGVVFEVGSNGGGKVATADGGASRSLVGASASPERCVGGGNRSDASRRSSLSDGAPGEGFAPTDVEVTETGRHDLNSSQQHIIECEHIHHPYDGDKELTAKHRQYHLYGSGPPSASAPPLILFGVIPVKTGRQTQFLLLATLATTCSVAFALLQEGVTRMPDFKYFGWMTVLTSAAYALCGMAEMTVKGRGAQAAARTVAISGAGDGALPGVTTSAKQQRPTTSGHGGNSTMPSSSVQRTGAPGCSSFFAGRRVFAYLCLSMLTFAGMYCTNLSLSYIDYTTRIVAKSSKVIPVMLFSSLSSAVRGGGGGMGRLLKLYTLPEWLAATLLVFGVIEFSLGDRVMRAESFNAVGIVLICVAVAIDAGTGVFEERVLFKVPNPACHAELLCYTSSFSTLIGLCTTATSGELWPALMHSWENPAVPARILSAAIVGYMSVNAILLLIRNFSATDAEIVKSCRKVFSISLSFVFFRKSINSAYVAGFAFVLASLAITYVAKERKHRERDRLANSEQRRMASSP